MKKLISICTIVLFYNSLILAQAIVGPSKGGSGGGTPGGANKDVQCNISNAFGACETGIFTHDAATHTTSTTSMVATSTFGDGTNYKIKWDGVNSDVILRNNADAADMALQVQGLFAANRTVTVGQGGNSFISLGSVVECSTSGWRIDGCTFGSGSKIVWTSGTVSGTADVGLSRNAAGVIETNTGTPGTFASNKNLADIRGGSVPTISGCSAGTQTGGLTAGTFTSGTTGACAVTLTFSVTAPTGWACYAANVGTPANIYSQSGGTTTTATFTGSTTSGNVIRWGCIAY